jgi:hypothetical protein
MLRFLGIGAQKAGTTWLYELLRQHPEIGFPDGKESHHWTRREAARDRAATERYLARFPDPHRVEGEITPAYATLDDAGIACIRAAAPDLRLIFILRNPLERAWSAAFMVLRRLEMEPAEASDGWFETLLRSEASLQRGDYAETIRRWRRWFPGDALLILRFEALRDEPEPLINRCLRHIGVQELDPAALREMGSRRVIFTGAPQPPRPAIWAELQTLYQPRIAALEAVLGEDLSAWLAPPAELGPPPTADDPR